MSWRKYWSKMRDWSRDQRERELEEEIRAHLEIEAEEQSAAGVPADEARFAARRAFGNTTLALENSREAWQFNWIESLWRDLKHGWRMLARSPGFAVLAVLTLALGIGATSSMFSLLYEMLLRQPTVTDPQRLMVVSEIDADSPKHLVYASPADLRDWQQRNHSFAALAGAEMVDNVDWARNGEPVRIPAMRVTANFFDVAGVHPALGRTLITGEDQPGHGGEVLLSHGFWETQLQSDPDVVGRHMRFNTDDYTVVGVLPASFNLWGFPAQVWIPRVFEAADFSAAARSDRSLIVFGRLRPGLSIGNASAEMKTIAAEIAREYPATNRNWSANVLSLRDYRTQMMHDAPAVVVLISASVLILLIACINVAGLLVARARARQREIAVRAALGAGRRRLLRQLLTEGLLLACIACGLGLVLAYWGIGALHRAASWSEQAVAIPFQLNWPVVIFALVTAAVSVLLFALAPSLQVAKRDLQDVLKENSGRSGSGAGRARLRRLLVGGEIVLSLFLVAGSCMLIGDLIAEFAVNFGFNPKNLLTLSVELPEKAYAADAQRVGFYEKAIDRIHHLPGVESVAISNALPITASSDYLRFTTATDVRLAPENRPFARYYVVSPQYFATLQIALLQGRAFTAADRASSAAVTVINQKLADKFFARVNPVGQYLNVYFEPAASPRRCQVIGVVAGVKDWLGEWNDPPQLYLPIFQLPHRYMSVAARASGGAAMKDLGRTIWALGADQPVVGRTMTMDELIDVTGGAGDKLLAKVMGLFTLLAVLLAAVGIYGVIAYMVSQRTREIGIRMALGANRAAVVAMVLREAAVVGGAAIVFGVLATLPLPKIFAGMFNGLGQASAMAVLIGTPISVAVVVLAASAVPCLRAARTSPAGALRWE